MEQSQLLTLLQDKLSKAKLNHNKYEQLFNRIDPVAEITQTELDQIYQLLDKKDVRHNTIEELALYNRGYAQGHMELCELLIKTHDWDYCGTIQDRLINEAHQVWPKKIEAINMLKEQDEDHSPGELMFNLGYAQGRIDLCEQLLATYTETINIYKEGDMKELNVKFEKESGLVVRATFKAKRGSRQAEFNQMFEEHFKGCWFTDSININDIKTNEFKGKLVSDPEEFSEWLHEDELYK